MARPLRIEYEGAVYHVAARGNDKQTIFTDEKDYRKFLAVLEKKIERYGVVLYAYVLMGNHYHLLFETPAANITAFMHDLQSHYTGYYNRRHEKVGHLFQGRYKGLVVESDAYLLKLSRYIHLNPVRAGFARKPEDWLWSSYREYAGLRKKIGLVESEKVLSHYGQNMSRAKIRYREMIEAEAGGEPEDIMSKVTAQSILGSDDFVERIKKMIRKQNGGIAGDISSGRQLARWGRKEADDALEIVAGKCGVDVDVLKEKGRHKNQPRDLAVTVFHRLSKWSLEEIGTEFGTSRSAVSKIVSRAENIIRTDKQAQKLLDSIFATFPA